MSIKDPTRDAEYGPSWNDVYVFAEEVYKATKWPIRIAMHTEVIQGRARGYWRVIATRPETGFESAPPMFVRGAFFPSIDHKTVPGLLHRLIAEVDHDLAKLILGGGDLPLFNLAGR